MKKVWIGLSVACLGIGIVSGLTDVIKGDVTKDTGAVLFVMTLFAAFFGYLAWLWRIKSPLKRAKEQIDAATDTVKKSNDAYKKLPKSLKQRVWEYRIVGTILCGIAVWICIAGNWENFPVVVATVILIIGIALFILSSPEDYNNSTDAGKMVIVDREITLEEIYEAFKNVKTPFGSVWMGRFHTSFFETLVFGPSAGGQLVYFWLDGNGDIIYIGSTFVESTIKVKLTEPLIPPVEDNQPELAGRLCYHSDVFFFQKWLKESLEQFIKTGQVLPFRETLSSEIYTFTENFKLTGEHFEVQDADGNTMYVVDGTIPLVNLYIYDKQQREVFRLQKEVGHALATYSFFQNGEPYGVLEKQFTFVRDKFAMDIREGRLELIEYTSTIGHNFRVELNGRVLGAIIENMDITVENLVFDNAFLVVYEKEYLPLVTAMAVMVTRELARDRN